MADTKETKELINLEEALLNKEFIEFPKELDRKCTKEQFHIMMTSHNSDIPINQVNFLDYPDLNCQN